MSAVLVARGLAVRRGDRTLFSGLDLTVGPEDVIGLVGANGVGKSSLLRVLAGDLVPDTGSVSLSPRSAHVGFLTQEPDRRVGETVREFLGRRTGVTEANEAMEAAAHALGDETADSAERYSLALESWLAMGGADLEERMPQVAAERAHERPKVRRREPALFEPQERVLALARGRVVAQRLRGDCAGPGSLSRGVAAGPCAGAHAGRVRRGAVRDAL